MKIVHFSKTPLAGAPIRLVEALQRHTNYDVHLVDLKRWDRYDHDVVRGDDPERTFELARTADIIHLHNYLGYQSREFHPVDFDALRKDGKVFKRQFHSHPNLVALEMQIDVRTQWPIARGMSQSPMIFFSVQPPPSVPGMTAGIPKAPRKLGSL